jgi:hypothetical protein
MQRRAVAHRGVRHVSVSPRDARSLAGIRIVASRVSSSHRAHRACFRGNVRWSERYVLSPPGSLSYCLDPVDSGYANRYLAAVWTVTSINGGGAEAAFESGLRAALGLRGEGPGT